VERLNAIINKAVEKWIFRGGKIGRNNVVVSHLQYADDTIFFGEWNLGSSDSANIPGVPVSTRCDAGTGTESGRDAGRRKWTRLFPEDEDEEMHFNFYRLILFYFPFFVTYL
jgi:hypothetical protein